MRITKSRSITCFLFVGLILISPMRVAVAVPQVVAQSSLSTKKTKVEEASGLLAEGVAAFQRDDLTTAQSYFEKALQANPKDGSPHTYLGIISDRNGDFAAAERHFAAATVFEPGSPLTHNNHGASLMKLGRTQEAANEFLASLRLDKNQPNALVNLAQIRFSKSTPADLREARELFERAYAIAPDREVSRALVVISLRLGERDAARKFYREYLTRFGTTTDGDTRTAAPAELGAALLEAGLGDEAVTELKLAVAADPSNTETIVSLAKAYVAIDDLPAAGRTLEGALARGLDGAPIYALLASVYEKSGHIENAIPAMRLAIERDPQSETYRFAYGMLLTTVLAPDAAVIRLKESIELFPQSARLWLALGIAHFKAGRNDEASEALKRAIELDPKYGPPFAYLGMTYVETGQYGEAIKSYERALAVNDKLGVVDFLLAEVLLKQASVDEALISEHLVRAVKLEPSFAPARLALGKLYARGNRLTEAQAELEEVIKLDPNLAEAYYQLGRVYARLKRPAEAQVTLATFKRLSDSQKEQQLKDRKEIVRRLANVRF
jgi:Tfp pilus assembly protein PilF